MRDLRLVVLAMAEVCRQAGAKRACERFNELQNDGATTLLSIPESPQWALAASNAVHDVLGLDLTESMRLPIRFTHAERWRAEVLAIWRGCTVDDLTAQGLVVIAPEPKPVDETWRARLEALCAEHGWYTARMDARQIGRVAKNAIGSGNRNCYIGQLMVNRYDTEPRPPSTIEVYAYEGDAGTYALDFRPMHHEATGRAQALAARAAFDRACTFADILEAAGPWPFEWPVVDAAEDDIPL